jgi:hypothetical protein
VYGNAFELAQVRRVAGGEAERVVHEHESVLRHQDLIARHGDHRGNRRRYAIDGHLNGGLVVLESVVDGDAVEYVAAVGIYARLVVLTEISGCLYFGRWQMGKGTIRTKDTKIVAETRRIAYESEI